MCLARSGQFDLQLSLTRKRHFPEGFPSLPPSQALYPGFLIENPAYELLDLWNVTSPLCVSFSSSIVRINQEESVSEDNLAYCGGLFVWLRKERVRGC